MKPPHIVLTTDFSAESFRAFEPVAALQRALDARLTLLHVVHDQIQVVPPTESDVPMMRMEPEEAVDAARQQLEELRDRFAGAREVAVEAVVSPNVPAAILDYARRHGVDYIAMATHGRSGIKRLLLGSIAEQVVRLSSAPVILYPARDAITSLRG